MSAFATLNISPDVLRVMATQARVGELHFYMPTRCSRTGVTCRRWPSACSGAPDPFGEAAGENRLLEAWGAAGRDFMAGSEVVHPAGEIAAYSDPEEDTRPTLDEGGLSDSLLHRLQRDLFHRRALPSGVLRDGLRSDDPSLQVHACHTRLRELQVLHDQLRSLLQDPRFDPPLQAREIAVLAPDIDPYVPYLEAVFGRGGEEEHIPYALADSSPLAGEPLADVFVHLLGLPVSRFGLNEVLDLLASARRWPKRPGWKQWTSIACMAGCSRPAHAGAWMRSTATSTRRRPTTPTPVRTTAWCSVTPPAARRTWPAWRRGSSLKAARWKHWTGLLALRAGGLPASPRRAADPGAVAATAAVAAGRAAADRAQLAQQPACPRAPAALLNQFADDAAKAGFEDGVPPEVVRSHFAGVLGEADTRAAADRWHQFRPHGADAPAAVPGDLRARSQ